MAVGGGGGVDGILQAEAADDGGGAEVEELADLGGNLCIRPDTGTVGVYVDADGLCNADGIGELHEAFVGNAGGYQVLCQIACGIGGAAVHFRRIFSGEGTAAVGTASAVGIYDDLAAGKSGVSGGPADDELAGGIYVEDEFTVEEGGDVGRQGADEAGEYYLPDILLDAGVHGLVGIELVVLGT